MKYKHTSGRHYIIGDVIEPDTKKRFDITVIYDFDATSDPGDPPVLVGWYFGSYDEMTTRGYVGLYETNKRRRDRERQRKMDRQLMQDVRDKVRRDRAFNGTSDTY